jgi:hypothetical protein
MPMTKTITAFVVAAFFLGCGPAADDEPDRVGHIEYEYGPWAARGVGWEAGEWYRAGRRIELWPEKNPYEPHVCAMLTPEAYDELERTIAALDPNVDYALADGECSWQDAPSAVIHIEGFTHSPFWCDWVCCREELVLIPSTYFLAANELSDDPIEIHGEAYPVVDVDESCD